MELEFKLINKLDKRNYLMLLQSIGDEEKIKALKQPEKIVGRYLFHNGRLIELEDKKLQHINLCGYITNEYRKVYKKWATPKLIWIEPAQNQKLTDSEQKFVTEIKKQLNSHLVEATGII